MPGIRSDFKSHRVSAFKIIGESHHWIIYGNKVDVRDAKTNISILISYLIGFFL